MSGDGSDSAPLDPTGDDARIVHISLDERKVVRRSAEVEQERARREQAQANEERQRAGMQKRMMWLLHQQVQRYWLLAKMCNDVIVHATTSGLFLYLSPKCKALLGYD